GPLRAPIAPDALIASNPNNVYISQVYGGGGNAGATLKNDFIELYNGGSSTVDLTGWTVQNASSTGSSWTNLTKLSGSIAPGQYFLIREALGGGGTVDLPTPDVIGTINMSAMVGKVALVSNSTALSGTGCPPSATVVDFVGYGTGTNCFEGTGPTAALANTTAALRKDGGRQDTDQNSADFTVGAPAPRNTSSPILPPLNAVMVTISPATPAVVMGATVNFTATAAKSGAASTITSAAWTSSNTAVATIDAATGVATTLSSGTTTIGVTVATSDGGASGTTTLTASAAPATVTLSPTTWSLKVAQTKQFTATSADAGGQPVTSTYTWSSADPTIATVSASGLATGVAVGATTISATTPNGKVGSATVTVTAAAGFLSVAARTTPLPVGFQTQLFLTGTGTDKNGKTITNADLLWSTADAATVSVEPSTGVITAKKVGSVVITATATSDGVTSGSTTITTNDPPVSATARVGHNTELGVPTDADPSDDVIIARRQYTMSYNASHAGPNWVSWNLDASHTGGSARCNCFTADTALTRLGITAYNTNDWVNGGIWSRGHMSPSADWADSDGDNAPTFFLSNMIPQKQAANSGAWGDLENYLRTLAVANAEIYIVAGPIFTKGRTNGKDGFGFTTGTGHIAVPDSMWKVAIVVPDGRSAAQITNPADVRVIAVNMPNEATSVGGWANFSTTIARIQKSTGYDLLSALPERIQCTLESRACAPSARIAGAAGGIEGQTLTFDGSTSTDPNAGGTLTYQWSLNGQPLAGGTTPQISYGFADNGAYTLRLVTGDQFGLADTTTATVTVTNAAPVVQPATATSARARESSTLSASFSDAGVNDAPWNYVIHWGDGTGGEYATSGTTNTPGAIGGTHAYASAGTYTIHVDVTDKDGGAGSAQLQVTVDPAESTPVGTNVAVSPVDPTTGTQPVAISFATVSSGGVTTIASANTPPAATSAIQ
ncbi:MAG: non-specific endonuclease, partial [Gemmatimonadetes bacterium]|nr:non-specific endonuclease [Gemmatimonadota bacterium]